MNESRAAIRYAKAVISLAIDHKATDIVEKDMRNVTAKLSKDADLREMLGSPIVKAEAKKKALSSVLKGSHRFTEGLLSVLMANKRIGLLEEVALKYIILNEKLKGEAVAYVTTAVPLTSELEKDILKRVEKITGNKVTIKNKIDEKVIGGFVLRIGDLQYDASIANKLNGLKREFTNRI